MTLTIDLTPEEERRLYSARAQGIDVDALIKGLIAGLPEVESDREEDLEELFDRWEAEDANLTPEEIAKEIANWEAFKKDVNATRAETGERPIFK